jgi:predicted flap endonuclease-1-like 5' DNA nuclease
MEVPMRHLVAASLMMVLLTACGQAPMPMAAMAPLTPAPTVEAEGTRAYQIENIEGIGPAYAAKLREQGITNTKTLLQKLASRKDRTAVAQATGISDKRLLGFANKADLMRIAGIGPQMSDLLEAIGINTVPQLAQRADHEALRERMRFANEISKAFVKQLPTPAQVRKWIDTAKTLDRTIQY